jgi:hypothetical protein
MCAVAVPLFCALFSKDLSFVDYVLATRVPVVSVCASAYVRACACVWNILSFIVRQRQYLKHVRIAWNGKMIDEELI